MTLKVTQSSELALFDNPLCRFLLVVCSNNLSVLHRFRDITTHTAYVTACDLEKSFSFDETVEMTSHTRAFRFMCKISYTIHATFHEVWSRITMAQVWSRTTMAQVWSRITMAQVWSRITMAQRHKLSTVRRLNRRLLDLSKNAIFIPRI